MPRNREGPIAPHRCEPDLPRVLDDASTLERHDDVQQSRIVGLSGDVHAAHARVIECRVSAALVERLDLTGATLVDVEIEDLRATTVVARSGRWRSVRIVGGRIGTLDLSGAEVETVELRGVRIDYLTLAQARVSDLLLIDCVLGTVDVPHARLERAGFEKCRADEVDTRELRARDLDLRGLEALSFTDPTGLRGATLSSRQAEALSTSFASALGIDVRG